MACLRQAITSKLSTFQQNRLLKPRNTIWFHIKGAPSRAHSTSNASPPHARKRVATHNGSFHCDEALACFMIRRTHKFSNTEIIRTRNPNVLETADAVLDVGGVYEPGKERYDHHQKGFMEVLGHGFDTKLSSAGLVYKHYGKEIISKELQLDEGHPDVDCLYHAIYKNFVEAVDAIDNGIGQYNGSLPARYVNNTSLSSRVGRLNLDWTVSDQTEEKENEAFERAMALTGSEFLECIHFHARSWLPAWSIVMECLRGRKEIDPSGEIMVLGKSCPWKLHIFELEKEMGIEPCIKYVVYQDDRSETWRLQAVAVGPERFESRKPLPSEWRGLDGEELIEAAGIPGCVFIHSSGFIGGNRSYEGALTMARSSLTA